MRRVLVLCLLPLFFLIGCGSNSAAPTTIELTIPSGQSEPIRQVVPLNSEVTLKVSSQEALTIHVHGFEKEFKVPAGGSAETTFKANLSGVFEIESHDTGKTYMKLNVK